MSKKRKTYAKTKLAISGAAGLVASVAGLAVLPAVGVGAATWLTVRWLDK